MPAASTCHPELQALRRSLQEISQSASAFGPTLPKPPILDSSLDISSEESPRTDAVRGLRALRDSVKRDLDVLEKFLANPDCARLPSLSTNAPYLIAVWNEVLSAHQPVTAIWSTFSETGKAIHPRRRGVPKEAGVKVDVVAEGGKRWIRVNTTKNSRMLAEFREIDSYLTDSEDSDQDGDPDHVPSLAQIEFDNSLLRMGRSLLAAARENPVPGSTDVPAVTLRLTRLDPSPPNLKEHDPRISQTIEALKVMGIDVQLGEKDRELLHAAEGRTLPTRTFTPANHINLDLSILIALVSDITHAPLPSSPDDAEARFTPSAEYIEWKKKRLASMKTAAGPEDEDAGPDVDLIARSPSRALVCQALQEMTKGLLQEMFDRLYTHAGPGGDSSSDPSSPAIQFWTTPEAKDRCLQIVKRIGGPKEQQRVEALFMDDFHRGTELYWQDSRYPKNFIPLLPIRLLPHGDPGEELGPPTRDAAGRALSPFFGSLATTCREILRHETIPDPRTTSLDDSEDLTPVAVTKVNPKLTAHTVQSLLWGALRGWTTLTANRTSVKAILKEMRAANNGALWRLSDGVGGDEADGGVGTAAIWTVDPRSLAEGMRADFRS